MPETDPVVTRFSVDDAQWSARMDEAERKLKRMEERSDRAGKKAKEGTGLGALGAAAIGGAAGFVAGAAMNNPAVSSVTDLLLTVVASALLPIFTALLPVIERIAQIIEPLADAIAGLIAFLIDKFGVSAATNAAIGALIGGRVAGPWGAVAGAAVAGGGTLAHEGLKGLQQPLSQAERDKVERETGGMIAPPGTVLIGPGDRKHTVGEPDEKVWVHVGPIPVLVNRDRLFGPTVVH